MENIHKNHAETWLAPLFFWEKQNSPTRTPSKKNTEEPSDDDTLGLKGDYGDIPSLNEPKWNIALNDNKLRVDPDISFSLYISLLDINDEVTKVEKRTVDMEDESAVLAMFAQQMTALANEPSEGNLVKGKEVYFITEEERNIDPQAGMTEEEKQQANIAASSLENRLRKRMKKTPLTPDHFRTILVEMRRVLRKNKKVRKAKAKQLRDAPRNLGQGGKGTQRACGRGWKQQQPLVERECLAVSFRQRSTVVRPYCAEHIEIMAYQGTLVIIKHNPWLHSCFETSSSSCMLSICIRDR